MVLFTEAETMLLLDLYCRLRARARNVTAGGVLLRQSARRRLAAAMNRHYRRVPPWTEAQLAVKVKNLRSEYAELRWLGQQPGFNASGAGLSGAWWAAVKARRPKAHVFKGKLPWVFERRVALVVGDLPSGTRVATPVSERIVEQLLDDLEAEDGPLGPDHGALGTLGALGPVETDEDGRRPGVDGGRRRMEAALAVASIERRADTPSSPESPATAASPDGPEIQSDGAPAAVQQASPARKRPREDEQDEDEDERGGRRARLARSVAQSSAAAAGMAAGFQELVSVFQGEAARYRRLESAGPLAAAAGAAGDALADQRGVVLAIARSLEQSTRATAEMALGFHDLVRLLAREAGAA